MSKLFGKLIRKRLKPIIAKKHLVPTHQFGFSKNHSTIDQVHRITDIIEKTLDHKGACSAVFLDIAQAFDRVWHRGLLHKLRSILPDNFYLLLKSHLTNRHFRVRHEDSYSELKLIKAANRREVYWGQFYIDATSADETAVMAIGETVDISTRKLKSAVNKVPIWIRKWRIKLNESKSVHIDSTSKKIKQQPIFIDGTKVPYANTANILV
jgi:hypothetical protein